MLSGHGAKWSTELSAGFTCNYLCKISVLSPQRVQRRVKAFFEKLNNGFGSSPPYPVLVGATLQECSNLAQTVFRLVQRENQVCNDKLCSSS